MNGLKNTSGVTGGLDVVNIATDADIAVATEHVMVAFTLPAEGCTKYAVASPIATAAVYCTAVSRLNPESTALIMPLSFTAPMKTKLLSVVGVTDPACTVAAAVTSPEKFSDSYDATPLNATIDIDGAPLLVQEKVCDELVVGDRQ